MMGRKRSSLCTGSKLPCFDYMYPTSGNADMCTTEYVMLSATQ